MHGVDEREQKAKFCMLLCVQLKRDLGRPLCQIQMVILDFTEATGLDASAARSCFLMLKQLFKTHDIECVFVISSKKIRALLEAHDVIELGEPEGGNLDLDSDVDLDSGLDWDLDWDFDFDFDFHFNL